MDPEGSVASISGELLSPYERPPISKGYLTGQEGLDQPYLKGQDYYADNKIKVVNYSRAEKLVWPPLTACH